MQILDILFLPFFFLDWENMYFLVLLVLTNLCCFRILLSSLSLYHGLAAVGPGRPTVPCHNLLALCLMRDFPNDLCKLFVGICKNCTAKPIGRLKLVTTVSQYRKAQDTILQDTHLRIYDE